jgi:drug/metabolite transporter (DMT)-like permease
MASKSLTKNLIILHITVVVWGFTGILGKLISISASPLVWYRVLIAFIALFVYFKVSKADIKISKNAFLKLFFTGAIVGLHWILFFQSIKLSAVSIALVCLSSITLFTAILEPLFNRKKIDILDVFTGLLIIIGITLIFNFESRYKLGIISGLSSALCASIFSIINAKQIKNRSAPIISFYELAGAWVWISIYNILTGGFENFTLPGTTDSIYLLFLGVVCTSVAYVAGVAVMQDLSAFRVALITNLEPVYGIILAFIIFGKTEQMTDGFYIGAAIVLTSIFLHPLIQKYLQKRKIKKEIPIV